MANEWDRIFNVNKGNFIDLALEIFQFQYQHNPIYRAYVDMLRFNPKKINSLTDIPFLPIQFFKSHQVRTTNFETGYNFESSGTTQNGNSYHFIRDIEIYRKSFTATFELFYGPVEHWCIIGLLPSYLERKNSSLVFMVDELIRNSRHEQSGFYLDEYQNLHKTLTELEEKKQKTLLIGVTFALLDFSSEYAMHLRHTIVMETGGMKGRREELIREELHEILKGKFQTGAIHSEYGMTELLSQAYSASHGIFNCPPWMKVLIRDEEDPLEVQSSESGVQSSESGVQSSESGVHSQEFRVRRTTSGSGRSLRGVINVIDLANIYSCSFIATDDAGKLYEDGSFEVMGRVDNSDIRGCSLLAI